MTIPALTLVYCAVFLMVAPKPEATLDGKAFLFLPHRGIEAGSPGFILLAILQLGALVVLGIWTLVMPSDIADLINLGGVAILMLLIGVCLWERRSRFGSDANDDRVREVSPKTAGSQGLIYGPEAQLLALASFSRRVAWDLKDVGIDGVRFALTRYFPETLPADTVFTPLPGSLHDSILSLVSAFQERVEHNRDLIEKLQKELADARSDFMTSETELDRLNETNSRLSEALAVSRQASQTSFGRGFSDVAAESDALIARLREIAQTNPALNVGPKLAAQIQ